MGIPVSEIQISWNNIYTHIKYVTDIFNYISLFKKDKIAKH